MGIHLTLCRITYAGPANKPHVLLDEVEGFDSLRKTGDLEFWQTLQKCGVVYPEYQSDSMVVRPRDFKQAKEMVRQVADCSERHFGILQQMEDDESIWLWVC